MRNSFYLYATILAMLASYAMAGALTDSRNGKKYRTIKIGSQEWMAENLEISLDYLKDYVESNPLCCLDEQNEEEVREFLSKEEKKLMEEACPAGWTVPTTDDVIELGEIIKAKGKECEEEICFLLIDGGKKLSQRGWDWGNNHESFLLVKGGSGPFDRFYNSENTILIEPGVGGAIRCIKKDNKVSSEDNPYAYLSERRLTRGELSGYSSKELRILRNAIFARHGYIFKGADLKKHFSKFKWYTPVHADVSGMLSAIEQDNVKLIKSME